MFWISPAEWAAKIYDFVRNNSRAHCLHPATNVMATQLTCMECFVLQASEHGMVGSSVYTVYELHSGDDTSGAGNCGTALACWESSLEQRCLHCCGGYWVGNVL